MDFYCDVSNTDYSESVTIEDDIAEKMLKKMTNANEFTNIDGVYASRTLKKGEVR